MSQIVIQDRFKLLESIFKKNVTEEEKASGIDPPQLSEIQKAVGNVLKKQLQPSSNIMIVLKLMLKSNTTKLYGYFY